MRPGFHSKLFLLSLFFASSFLSPALLAADPIWIDVRTMDEYNGGHVSAAVNIPYTEISEGIAALTGDKDTLIYVYCRSGRRSGIAKETLDDLGYTQVVNVGGFEQAMKKFAADSARETAR
ncbi:MAG: rhodanese-like domain-containing protein [Xanthomonadales bacterium]